jgi:biopolymer transport protein ExbD
MTWSIRHQGSPWLIEGLRPAQVVQGLADGLWEPTDEVRGPGDHGWVALEMHPQFAQAAADLTGPPEAAPSDETRLDMNPLIDVALVLLVFFILTTSYAALQKVLDMPTMSRGDNPGPPRLDDRMWRMMIRVAVSRSGDETVYEVDGQRVAVEELKAAIQQYVRPGRTVSPTRAKCLPRKETKSFARGLPGLPAYRTLRSIFSAARAVSPDAARAARAAASTP